MGNKRIFKEKLFTLFPINPTEKDDPKKYSFDDYLNIYEAIKAHIPFSDQKENMALCRFLYAACVVFDRFSIPTPFYINREEMRKKLNIFLHALIKAEGKATHNSVIFMLKQLKAQLYEEVDFCPIKNIPLSVYERYKAKIKEIPNVQKSDEKYTEYNKELNEFLDIIEGIKDKSLKTIFVFKIPYLLLENESIINFTWRKLNCTLSTKHITYERNSDFLRLNTETVAKGAPKWSNVESEITIEISGLVDGEIQTPSLQTFLDEKNETLWPACYKYCYNILILLFWKIQSENSHNSITSPTPTDLGAILSKLSTSKNSSIDWKWRTNPAVMFKTIYSPNKKTEKINFESIDNLPPMHFRCRRTAQMYLETGLFTEAVFWLNVGIEAFFESKFLEFSDLEISLSKDLSTAKSYWKEAEDIISIQFPEITQQIKWPEINLQPSIFSKLKYVDKKMRLKINKKDTEKKYNIIRKYRNDIFHGRSDIELGIDYVIDAFRSFDYLVQNYHLKDI